MTWKSVFPSATAGHSRSCRRWPTNSSSWISRHAAFVGVSGGRLLRHCNIEVPSVRDLDLSLSHRHAVLLADFLRCSPHLVRNMTQPRGGRVRSRLVATRQPSQICCVCAHCHASNVLTRGARLRSWMEGWRITCPICGAALEDFRLLTRLFRADRLTLCWCGSTVVLVRASRSWIVRPSGAARLLNLVVPDWLYRRDRTIDGSQSGGYSPPPRQGRFRPIAKPTPSIIPPGQIWLRLSYHGCTYPPDSGQPP